MTAKSVARESSTASPFQMPPRLARLPSVPRPGSARAANAATSGTCAQIWSLDDKPSIAAVSHGSAATTEIADATAAQSQRDPDSRYGDAHYRDRRSQDQSRRGEPGQRDPERQAEKTSPRVDFG